jgi:hypothetical protein
MERDRDLLAMVDVELLVAGGAPRNVFTPVFDASSNWPQWRMDVEALRRRGWRIGDHEMAPPDDGSDDPGAVHPYALGPVWSGANSWPAKFTLEGSTGPVVARVDHELIVDPDDDCDPGPPLPSASPWRWRIDGLPAGPRCGRADNPALAAAAVESVLLEAGCTPFQRTATRRQLP